MNTLKNLVCTIEQAKKLEELGLLPASALGYLDSDVMPKSNLTEAAEPVDAWTASELKLLLGDKVKHPVMEPAKPKREGDQIFWLSTYRFEVYFPDRMLQFKNEPEACAAQLIILIDNGVMDIDEVNARAAFFFLTDNK